MKKHYLAQIDERNGEYEYAHTILLVIDKRASPLRKLNAIARDWYSRDPEKADGGYYFNCGEVFVSPSKFEEISETLFSKLKATRMLTVFGE